MKVYLGSDHRGFELKEKLKSWLEKRDIDHEDFGAHSYDKNDDYTTYAQKVASVVSTSNSTLGVLLCGSGVGVDIAANKFDNVRASVGINEDQVAAGRRDDDMNVLVIAADFTDEDSAFKMVKALLETKYENVKRHNRRLEEIKRIEQNN